jgi:hypothetical protein
MNSAKFDGVQEGKSGGKGPLGLPCAVTPKDATASFRVNGQCGCCGAQSSERCSSVEFLVAQVIRRYFPRFTIVTRWEKVLRSVIMNTEHFILARAGSGPFPAIELPESRFAQAQRRPIMKKLIGQKEGSCVFSFRTVRCSSYWRC